ncbi:COP9 signalosome complex subunit 8 [Hypsizygus marmoreus]|uniref:COP9 signalosome complex subunit 8 n=1 Tax=Hypsizygus marmoreus TaxID=39966 RepID=A0A369JGW2_HYPMA|nr:COP9 signalosome complex subunit 8 [Hypsizygus marmoreus]
MAGPPTPPPTTATELQDEARGNTSAEPIPPPPAALPTTPPTKEDAYQYIFPTIADLASQSDFHGLIQVAEHSDLNGDVDSDRRNTRLLVVAPLVLAYLIIDDLPPARYALTRLPEGLTSNSLAKALIDLLASTWDRKHANVYSRAESLFILVHQPGFYNDKLASVITGLIEVFVESFRQRTFALLSKAYTSLPLSLAETYIGLKADRLLPVAEHAQWSFDTFTDTLKPRPTSVVSTAPEPTFSSLSTFHFVADSVAKLELNLQMAERAHKFTVNGASW